MSNANRICEMKTDASCGWSICLFEKPRRIYKQAREAVITEMTKSDNTFSNISSRSGVEDERINGKSRSGNFFLTSSMP